MVRYLFVPLQKRGKNQRRRIRCLDIKEVERLQEHLRKQPCFRCEDELKRVRAGVQLQSPVLITGTPV